MTRLPVRAAGSGPAEAELGLTDSASRRRRRNLKVKIVTDSTASLPAELCRSLDITVVPVTIHFGSNPRDTFVDGVDPAEVFYARLMDAPQPPTTSTPSPGAFLETYRRLAADGAAIVSLHVMETKSTLVNVARLAAQMLPEVPIHVVDSQTTTLGLGLLAVVAARMAQAGRAAAEIVAEVERLIPQVHVYAAIRELTQLRRSGRVSLGQALIGGVLGIKPILYLGQGQADVVDKVRTWPRAVERLVEMARARVGEARVALAVLHTRAEAEAQALLTEVRDRFHCVETLVADAGTALAAHAGPGALGIVTLRLD
jgi:DegV family protein with EDD domain